MYAKAMNYTAFCLRVHYDDNPPTIESNNYQDEATEQNWSDAATEYRNIVTTLPVQGRQWWDF